MGKDLAAARTSVITRQDYRTKSFLSIENSSNSTLFLHTALFWKGGANMEKADLPSN